MAKTLNIVFMVLVFLSIQFCYAFEIKNPFKKNEPTPKVKMVETVEEWEIEAQNIPVEQRDISKKHEKETNVKITPPQLNYNFIKYNYPQGKRELNIEDIKKKLYHHPYLIADNKCRYVAYPYYYYSPDVDQISSEFYVEKLDLSKNKKNRILEYNHKEKLRTPILESGTKDFYPHLYNGLTLVDWNKDSTKLLIKEKIGSTINGIYKTNIYLYTLSNRNTRAKLIKLSNLDNIIKDYFLSLENKQLIKYRYDLMPIGFSEENDDIVIIFCYIFNKNNEKIFLGSWGYNSVTNEIILISKKDFNQIVSSNGIILEHTLE